MKKPNLVNRIKGYFNTTNLEGVALVEKKEKALSQNKKIEAFFKSQPEGKEFTHYEVLDKVFDSATTPATSIYRAFSSLTDRGVLEKTPNTKIGKYGSVNYTWKLSK